MDRADLLTAISSVLDSIVTDVATAVEERVKASLAQPTPPASFPGNDLLEGYIDRRITIALDNYTENKLEGVFISMIDDYDLSAKVDDALNDTDLSSAIENALDNYDFDNAFKEWFRNNVTVSIDC